MVSTFGRSSSGKSFAPASRAATRNSFGRWRNSRPPTRGVADFSRLVSEDYRQYRQTMRTAWSAAALLALLFGAASWQWRAAVIQRDRAVHAESAAMRANAEAQARAEEAKANLRQAQIGQSRLLADQARQRRAAGDAVTALLIALEGLPSADGPDRPYVPAAEFELDAAWRASRERLVLVHKDSVLHGGFQPRRPAHRHGVVRQNRASVGRCERPADPRTHGSAIDAAFSPDGKRVVTASGATTARLSDAATGKPIARRSLSATRASLAPRSARTATAS